MKHLKTIFRSPLISILLQLKHGIDKIMATLEEIQAAQAGTDAKVSAVAADVSALLAKIASFPAPGLTPEQQAAIDDIAAHASKINDSLAAVDASATA